MKTALAGVAAVALGLLSGLPAQAGHHRTKIVNSGNGAYNSIAVHNGHPGWPGPQFYPQYTAGLGGFGGPGMPVGYPPQAIPAPAPVAPAVNRNVITNSANGQGNSIAIQNGNFAYSYPGGVFGGVSVGGVNINVITNSGNGVGNSIGIVNH